MNAILLGAASLGALAAIFTANPGDTAAAKAAFEDAKSAQISEDIGSMTRTEISDIAIID